MQFVVNLSHVPNDAELCSLAHRLLEPVAVHNEAILRACPWIPPLYLSGVRFREEPWAVGGQRLPGGLEQFTHILEVLRRGWGDCAQLCAWRKAELRLGGLWCWQPHPQASPIWMPRVPESPDGERASLRYYVRSVCPQCPNGCLQENHPARRRCFHVEVRRPKAPHIEDPSRVLSF